MSQDVKFIINVGDSFYPDGVSSPGDIRWRTQWIDRYPGTRASDRLCLASLTSFNRSVFYFVGVSRSLAVRFKLCQSMFLSLSLPLSRSRSLSLCPSLSFSLSLSLFLSPDTLRSKMLCICLDPFLLYAWAGAFDDNDDVLTYCHSNYFCYPAIAAASSSCGCRTHGWPIILDHRCWHREFVSICCCCVCGVVWEPLHCQTSFAAFRGTAYTATTTLGHG